MRTRFVSLGPSGNGVDFILAVERRPGCWGRLLGARSEVKEYFGPHPQWVTMEGLPVKPSLQRLLDDFWRSHRADWSGRRAAPWTGLEPAAEDGQRPDRRSPAAA